MKVYLLSKYRWKGYFNRKTILSVLNKRPVTNEIFNDFKDYLTVIENATNSFKKFDNIIIENGKQVKVLH